MSPPRKILYLGADDRVRQLLSNVPEGGPVAVECGLSGMDLDERLTRIRPAVLIIDGIREPGREALDLAQAVNRDHPGLAVILFGGSRVDLRGALRAGVKDVIEGRDARALAELAAAAGRALSRPEPAPERGGTSLTAALGVLFDPWPAPVMITDREGCITRANRAAEKLLGGASGALVGKSFNSLHAPGGAPAPEGRLSRILRRASDGAGTVMRAADGGARTVSWIAARLPDDGGTLVVGRDVGPQLAAEREIAVAEARFRRLIRASLEGILILRVGDGRVLEINPALEKQLGLARPQWADRPVWEIGAFADAVPDPGALAALAKRTLQRRDEITLRAAAGPRLYEYSVHLASEGAERLLICNFRDLSELQSAYRQLQATHERVIAQERLRALGTMASGIAHDFNNALSPILGFSELLIDNPDLLSDRSRALHYLELIRTGAVDGGNVVSRLREFYRHREKPEELQAVNLNAIVNRVIEITQPRWKGEAQAAGARITVRCELGELPAIAGRESELREMLINLVLNALDAMALGGELCVHTDHLPSGRVVVEVSDTGGGMTPEVRRHCLEPFYSTKGERGTGLGLAMVYGTVQRHGGGIDISSIPGHGTTVSIYLPAHPEAGAAASPAADGIPLDPADRLRVLVAEDEPAIRELLREQLTADGHEVTLAADGIEALQRFRSGVHDVVITDGAMPRMSGAELARRLKARSHPPRVVLLSGFGDLMNGGDGRADAIDLVLRKPLSRHRLRSSLAARARRPGRGEDNAAEPRSDAP